MLEALVEDSEDIARSIEEAVLRNPGDSEWARRLEQARSVLDYRLQCLNEAMNEED